MIILSRRWSDVIDLIDVTEGKDASGFDTKAAETRRTDIFCNKKDVHSSEWHQAAAQGKMLDAMFIIHSIDYEAEKQLAHENKRYSVERTYDRGEFVELICQSRGEDDGF